MSVNLARTAEGWWAQAPAGLVRLDLPAASTGELGPALMSLSGDDLVFTGSTPPSVVRGLAGLWSGESAT